MFLNFSDLKWKELLPREQVAQILSWVGRRRAVTPKGQVTPLGRPQIHSFLGIPGPLVVILPRDPIPCRCNRECPRTISTPQGPRTVTPRATPLVTPLRDTTPTPGIPEPMVPQGSLQCIPDNPVPPRPHIPRPSILPPPLPLQPPV